MGFLIFWICIDMIMRLYVLFYFYSWWQTQNWFKAPVFYLYFPHSLRSMPVWGHESDRCCSFLPSWTYFMCHIFIWHIYENMTLYISTVNSHPIICYFMCSILALAAKVTYWYLIFQKCSFSNKHEKIQKKREQKTIQKS